MAEAHPTAASGVISPNRCVNQFISLVECDSGTGFVHWENFLEYYRVRIYLFIHAERLCDRVVRSVVTRKQTTDTKRYECIRVGDDDVLHLYCLRRELVWAFRR